MSSSKKSQIIDIPVLDVSESEEEEEIVTEIVPKAKAKRPVTAEQKAHLDKIRVKALEVKAQQKEITLKAKLSKSIEKNEIHNLTKLHEIELTKTIDTLNAKQKLLSENYNNQIKDFFCKTEMFLRQMIFSN